MPDNGNIDHHRAIKYVETQATDPGGQFTVTWTPDGRNVTVVGPCPTCGGRTATDFSRGIGGAKGYRSGIFKPESLQLTLPSPVTLFCECGHAHVDRPDDAYDRGCGRYWQVHLTEDERRPPAPGSAKP